MPEGDRAVLRRFGRSKQEAEDFVDSFEDVSVTRRLRIMGDDVRLFRCFPGDWQVMLLHWSTCHMRTHGAHVQGLEAASVLYVEPCCSFIPCMPAQAGLGILFGRNTPPFTKHLARQQCVEVFRSGMIGTGALGLSSMTGVETLGLVVAH